MKKFLVCAAALMLALVGVLAACGEKKNGADPTGEKEEEQVEEKERELRNLPEDVKYNVDKYEKEFTYTDETLGEIKIYGEMYEPLDAPNAEVPGKLPAVIMAHGYNGNYDDFTMECNRLAERGYVAYAFDFCGAQLNGKSTGRTKENYSPLTMQRDLVEVFKHIQSIPYVDETQVFLWGGSQGGYVAALAAADDEIKDEVAALALYFPAFNIPDQHKNDDEKTFMFWDYYLNADYVRSVKNFDPYTAIINYKKDVCILWGEQDNFVPREYVERAAEAYGEDRAEFTVLTGGGAGHGFGEPALTKAIGIVMKFLEAHTYKPL